MTEKEKKVEKSQIAQSEEEILKFWQENKIFEKSEKNSSGDEFVFYDGPPFATGLPHYGHILAGTIKDVVPRYQTMLGKKVMRRWGWDCHGLPLENLVEKELKLKSKKDIEDFGIDKFNEKAKDSVLRYADDWKKIIPRLGRWVDMDKDYKTMDSNYTESVWWVFKNLYDKKLIFEGFKSMHLCPRCGTTLSNFEVNLGYADIKDWSVTVKLPLKDEPDTSLLIWTTTSWTLPGNMAAGVNPEVEYVKIKSENEYLILAKEKLESVMGEKEYEVVEEFVGEKLIGKEYIPPFDYYLDEEFENKENAWKLYGAEYVNIDEGTGIVHLAPAFGEEDMLLAQEKNIPIVHHVRQDGSFAPEVKDFVGLQAKPKGHHLETDEKIIENLEAKGVLFNKEKISHSYPHCWRCETPLLNYAASSWFVAVTEIKDKLVKANKKVNWVPKEVGTNRFGKWLLGARDWAISRSRYWGAPLPVWRCKTCQKIKVLGSVDDIRKETNKGNKYFVIRHGEAENNTLGILSGKKDNPHHLTEKGIEQVKKSAEKLKGEKIDRVISSPFIRTKETADIIADTLSIDKSKIVFDDRLGEIYTGELEGKDHMEYHNMFSSDIERFEKAPKGGENLAQVKKRVGDVLYGLERSNAGENILIITHELSAWMILSASEGVVKETCLKVKENQTDDFITNGQIIPFDFSYIPHNEEYELDLHRPYIDSLVFNCSCGSGMDRIPEVFDCWFESGSMPYGQFHYPFEHLDKFNPEKGKGFPADFIAEGMDQTRGWFYNLLVLGIALFGKSPYENVIVNGHILAENGKKMSKSLNNFPDPMVVVDKYGADALRLYLLSSPAVRGESLKFSEKGVDEVAKKVITRLKNVYSFYEMYGDKNGLSNMDIKSLSKDKNVLDLWIIARLKELRETITTSLTKYELDKASRPIADFVDDFSTWYLRRSRDRFKSEDEKDRKNATETLGVVLIELSKLIAPFTPFLAEDFYLKLKGEKESVHLESWPEEITVSKNDKDILEKMANVRKIVSYGLEARSTSGMKVRQPLQNLKIKDETLSGSDDLLILIKDEVNVKDVIFDTAIESDVELDLNLTDELKIEGRIRDIVRLVQGERKRAGLNPGDSASLSVSSSFSSLDFKDKLIEELKKTASITDIVIDDKENGEKIEINGEIFSFSIIKK